MSFLLPCPVCGPRDVYEFRYAGEVQRRPQPGSSRETWSRYLYERTNPAGPERAWWYHRLGCQRWFQAERDTLTNTVTDAHLPQPTPTAPAAASATGLSRPPDAGPASERGQGGASPASPDAGPSRP